MTKGIGIAILAVTILSLPSARAQQATSGESEPDPSSLIGEAHVREDKSEIKKEPVGDERNPTDTNRDQADLKKDAALLKDLNEDFRLKTRSLSDQEKEALKHAKTFAERKEIRERFRKARQELADDHRKAVDKLKSDMGKDARDRQNSRPTHRKP